jgi:hypothetical protein
MINPLRVDLFVEDRAHEAWFKPLLERLAKDSDKKITVHVRSARGGHARAIAELKLYQQSLLKVGGLKMPDILVVAIDANCKSFADAQQVVNGALQADFRDRTIKATPDPHVERWFLADLEAFHKVVGTTPSVKSGKCERDYYKNTLANAIVDAGFPPTLGGLEFAQELIAEMNYFKAGKSDSSLKHFVDEVRSRFLVH